MQINKERGLRYHPYSIESNNHERVSQSHSLHYNNNIYCLFAITQWSEKLQIQDTFIDYGFLLKCVISWFCGPYIQYQSV